MSNIYNFPEKNEFYAREVLDTDFDIKPYPDLYVEIDKNRINEEDGDFRSNVKYHLNINRENKLLALPNDYKKILFIGHRGTGKTLELRRLHNQLNHEDRYFSIHIEMEAELEIARLEAEDFFILLVLKLVRDMSNRGMGNLTEVFDDLLEDWLKDKEVKQEMVEKAGISLSGGAGLNDKNIISQLVSFLKVSLDIKGELARESKTTTTIREKIRKDFLTFVSKFNVALQEVRREVQNRHKGKDILFIVDGTEKAPASFYETLFQKNGHIFREIGANIITTAPIDAFYRLKDKLNLDFFERVDLPMVYLDAEEKKQNMSEIICKRVEASLFFEPDALRHLVEMSGGCFRQLLRLCSQTIFRTRGKKASIEDAQKAARLEGRRMFELLNGKQKDILRNKTWADKWAEPEVNEMLFSLVLLKYNGHAEINPILREELAKP